LPRVLTAAQLVERSVGGLVERWGSGGEVGHQEEGVRGGDAASPLEHYGTPARAARTPSTP
jgi:hypothetical protein